MELLSSEERNALRASFVEDGAAEAARAVFPSVGQLDPERTAALAAAVVRWLDVVALDLSRVSRADADLRPPRQQSVPRSALPPADETPFWARVDRHPGHYLLLSLPRAFAATLCERIYGAPLAARADRDLSAGEVTLLNTLTGGWIEALSQIWPTFHMRPCEPPTGGGAGGETGSPRSGAAEARGGSWLRLASTLRLGPVEGSVRLTMAPATARLLLGETGPGGCDPSSRAQVAERLGEVPLQIRAVLGETVLRLDELAALAVGDVLPLRRRTRDPVDVFVADRPVFRARAGLSGRQVAVELLPETVQETE